MKIRLIREVTKPSNRGPFHGQYLLQRALRRYGPAWLRIGGELQPGEVPWFWCWLDAPAACTWADQGRPFLLGPNVLFQDSRRPRQFATERRLCDARSCRLLFTESEWYRDLIAENLGPQCRAPIAVWPYPVELPTDPTDLADPADPTDPLIYAKSGYTPRQLSALVRRFPGSEVLRYGHYRREELLAAARRARVCVYLSDDDRGPLALAEVLLCGCPAVGIRRGAPWIDHRLNGAVVPSLDIGLLVEGIGLAQALSRERVAAAARRRFHPRTVVRQIVEAVEG